MLARLLRMNPVVVGGGVVGMRGENGGEDRLRLGGAGLGNGLLVEAVDQRFGEENLCLNVIRRIACVLLRDEVAQDFGLPGVDVRLGDTGYLPGTLVAFFRLLLLRERLLLFFLRGLDVELFRGRGVFGQLLRLLQRGGGVTIVLAAEGFGFVEAPVAHGAVGSTRTLCSKARADSKSQKSCSSLRP